MFVQTRRFFAQSLAIAAVSLLAAGTSHAADKVVLQLDWLPTGEKQAGYIGKARGFFAAENIEVELRRGTGAADALNRVATGGAQYGYSDIANVFGMRQQGAKVKAIMSMSVRAPHAIITRADTGIKSFADLAGKSVGTAPAASSNLFFPLVLEDAKLDISKINMISVDPPALGPMLLTKRVDGAMLWVGNVAGLVGPAQKAGIELVVLPFMDGKMYMYGSVLIASEEQLRTQPDLTRRFLRAMRRSFFAMNENPEETARAAHAENPQQDIAVETERNKHGMSTVFNEVSENGKLFGLFQPEMLAKTKDWLVRAKQLDASVDPEDSVDRSFLPPPAS